MDLLSKFKKGEAGKTYQRLDSQYRVNIYLGYSEAGHMSLVITEPGRLEKVKSTREIQVVMGKRKDGNMALSFNLLNSQSQPIFLLLCDDLIAECGRAGHAGAISAALGRWKHWVDMFSKRPSQLMDAQSIKGLLGELIFLRDLFIPKYGESKAVISWMGPMAGHKDFEIEDTWYEIKSVSESAARVEISSLSQLDSCEPGHLGIVRLEKTNASVDGAINLNKMVQDLENSLTQTDIRELFRFKIRNAGYGPDPEYDKECYRYVGRNMYKVTDGFPMLRRSEIDPAISDARYSILLYGLERFMEDEDDC